MLTFLLVEQYLSKFDFDGVTFQAFGFEPPVNFGNIELPPAPKGAPVKPRQRLSLQPEPEPPAVIIPPPQLISCTKCDKLDLTLAILQKSLNEQISRQILKNQDELTSFMETELQRVNECLEDVKAKLIAAAKAPPVIIEQKPQVTEEQIIATVTKMLDETAKKVLKEAAAKYTEAIDDLDARLTEKTETVIDTVSAKFKSTDKLVQRNQEAMQKCVGDMEERVRVKHDDQGAVNMSIITDMQAIKVAFEGIRKPFTTEMNNIRKENENINRELIRMSNQIRDVAA